MNDKYLAWFLKPKTRKHHNNKGYRQIKNGTTRKQVKAIAKRLKIKYDNNRQRIN